MFYILRRQPLFWCITRKNKLINLVLTKIQYSICGKCGGEKKQDEDVSLCPNTVRGLDHLMNPKLNKGQAFTLQERQAFGLTGLLAPCFQTKEDQLNICRISLERYKDSLNKYLYLSELHDTNETLFYSLLAQNVEKYMMLVNTPTIGLACLKYGLVYRRPRGMFISIHDKGHVLNVLKNWPIHDVRAIVFTDGERILGFGDLGAYGMGVPIGKLVLYTALANVKPHQCLPITLDVGTDNQELLEDPLYIGLRQKRVRGNDYDELVAEFMEACNKRFGANILLQFEDFALPNATRFLNMYRDKYCTFNDDIQCTASAAVAGLMTSERVTKKKLIDYTYLFMGAGSAGTGIANLTVQAMVEQGMSEKEAQGKIYMFDVDGLLSNKRDKGVPDHCKQFGKDIEPSKSFEECVEKIKPHCIIGASSVRAAFSQKVLNMMAKNTERPVVMALSNPNSRAECTAQEAIEFTDGKALYASGSPSAPVKYKDKTYNIGQGNNSYIFPGLALGLMACRAKVIPETVFLSAARTLANFVKEEDLATGRLYPPLSDIRSVAYCIALDIVKMAYEKGIATVYPKPDNYEKFLATHLYDFGYRDHLPPFYPYPQPPDIKVKSFDEAFKIHVQNGKAK